MSVQTVHENAYFTDRYEAGRRLSHKLARYRRMNPYVLAIPRGGVEVGYEIARNLGYPLDVIVSRKIGFPLNPEFGIGAVSESAQYLNHKSLKEIGLPEDVLHKLINEEKEEVHRRVELYRKDHALRQVKNKVVIIVDDGLATGATLIAAVQAVRKLSPSKIIFAAPVVAKDSLPIVKPYIDGIVCLHVEKSLGSISNFYKHFNQVHDKTVMKLLSSLSPN